MKQKRKVKSLISSRDGSNVFGATLLFLLGGVLFFGAISLLISSIGVEASSASSKLDANYDMEDNREVLFKLGLISSGGSNPVNEMYFKDDSLFVKGDTGISMDNIGSSRISFDKNVNFLGGDGEGAIIDSNNVTIIGGGKNIKIFEDNPNAVNLGGEKNTISKGNSSSEAPVILGGENNEIGQNQKGSAIAGGSNNKIGSGVSYGFILGGERNIISGGNENVIVGGSNVEVRPGMSDLFVFSDGKGSFKPEGGNAFYIDVEGGLGLDGDSVNGGVTSEGAISFGEINIFDQRCESQDVGVQGSWSGCLVGCTEAGKNDNGKWEMIDHGDICKEQCKNNSSKCMINPLEIEKPDNYSSYCTTGGVNTDNSTQCAANLLTGFGNVVFETYLIDSEQTCPDEYDIHNRCVFRCDTGYHLTGNYAGGLNGRDVRCYSDCVLPWDQTKTIKHNETITGYNVQIVKCSNDDYFFPYDTAIINVPVYTYGTRWLYGMWKATKSHGSYESCTNYDHEKLLVCDNGTLYVAKSDRKTRSSTPAIGVTGANYIYSGCTLQNYRCNTGVYNLTRNYIERTGDDQISIWNNTDRGTTTGTRGLYELCLDWNADNPTQNGASCSSIPANYHYKLTECQPGYHTGVGFENECKHDCYLQLRNGGTRTSHHSGHAIGYKTGDVTCNTTCESRELVCDDGDWKLGSLNGSVTTGYMYSGCFISNRYCETGVYNTTVTYDFSYYDESCVDLLGNNTNNTCDDGTTHYKLTNCSSGYHFSGGRSDAIMCESNYRYYSCESMTLPSSIPLNSQRIGTFTRYWDCQLTGNESRCWKSSNNCSWECKDHYWQPAGYNLCCHDSEHLERGSCAPNHKVGSCNQYAGTLGGTNCYWAGQAELEWNGVTYVYQGGCTQVCTGCENGTTQTTYTTTESCNCENYTITSTCINGEWSPALKSCSTPADCGGECEPEDCDGYDTSYYDKDPNADYDWCTVIDSDCDEGGTRYQFERCKSNYHLSGGVCVPDDYPDDEYECLGYLPYGAAVNTEENPDNNTTNYFCDATSTAACSYTCPSGQECDGTSGCKDIPPSSCSGAPCGGGTAEDGEDLTCYQPNVQCTSTLTTALYETHTCSDGDWDDEWENNDYNHLTPNLSNSSNCDSSYNSDSPQNDPHGRSYPCSEYGQKGSNNECEVKSTKWDLECDPGYALVNGVCQKIDTLIACYGSEPSGYGVSAGDGYYLQSDYPSQSLARQFVFTDYLGNGSLGTCKWTCECGYYKNGSSCSACAIGEYSSAGSTSCSSCKNKPSSNSYYTSNACSDSCDWECYPGYHKSGNSCVQDSCDCGYYNNNGTCEPCGAKKYSSAGASSCNTADVGFYANSSCSPTPCTNKPPHSKYTSNGSNNDCSWECDPGFHTEDNETCTGNTQTLSCDGEIPGCCEAKQGHGTYTKIWNGSSWNPSSKSWAYDASECGYFDNHNDRCYKYGNDCIRVGYNVCDIGNLNCDSPTVVAEFSTGATEYTWNCKLNGDTVDTCSTCRYNGPDNNGNCCAEGEILQGGSCASSGCTFQGQTIPNGGSITVYSSASPTCPTECQAGTVTCSNGQLGGNTNYTSLSCVTVSQPACGSTSDGWSTTFPGNEYTYDTCTYSAANGKTCTTKTMYKSYGCIDGYEWYSAYQNNYQCIPYQDVVVHVLNPAGANPSMPAWYSTNLSIWVRSGSVSYKASNSSNCMQVGIHGEYCYFKVPYSAIGKQGYIQCDYNKMEAGYIYGATSWEFTIGDTSTAVPCPIYDG